MRQGPQWEADAHVLQEKGPAKQPTGQKWLLDLNQKSENPWRDLFLWAVLQNRHEMATYFWAMVSRGRGSSVGAGEGRPPETGSPRARKVWQPLWLPAKSSKRCRTWRRRPRQPEPCARRSTSSWPWVSDRPGPGPRVGGGCDRGSDKGSWASPGPPVTAVGLQVPSVASSVGEDRRLCLGWRQPQTLSVGPLGTW